jgi:hypothetical protein
VSLNAEGYRRRREFTTVEDVAETALFLASFGSNALTLRQVADIVANHSQIHFSCGKRLGGFKRGACIGHLKPDRRRLNRRESACNG